MYETKKLKEIRKKYNYTIYDMAKKLDISPTYYSQIENKKRRLNYDTSIKIAHIFNLKPDDLFLKNSHKQIKNKKNKI